MMRQRACPAATAFACATMLLAGCTSFRDPLKSPPPQPDGPTVFREWATNRSSIMALAFSPDGRLLASVHGYKCRIDHRGQVLWTTNSVRLWQAGGFDPNEDAVFTVDWDTDPALSFLPDGRFLAVTSHGKLHAWNVAEQRLENRTFGRGEDYIGPVSEDLRVVVLNRDEGPATVLDSQNGRSLLDLPRDVGSPMAISRDARFLLALGNVETHQERRTLEIWDLKSGTRQSTFDVGGFYWTPIFSPDGTLVAATADGDRSVGLWDTATGKKRQILGEHAGVVRCAAFSPDGRLLAVGAEGNECKVWDVAAGRLVATLKHGDAWGITAVAFSADGQELATGAGHGMLRIWQVGK